MLDARVDTVISTTELNEEITTQNLKGSMGLYVSKEVTRSSTSTTTISSSSIIRRSECVSVTVQGEVAKRDMTTFASVMQSTIVEQMAQSGIWSHKQNCITSTQQSDPSIHDLLWANSN